MGEPVIKERVIEIVRENYAREGRGVTRQRLAKLIDWPQSRNLPGVRQAIAEKAICYDGSPEGRLIPWEAYSTEREPQ